MAESDSFIQEVSEEVRRDRMYAVWRRYGPLLIAAIVIVVVGAAALGWWESREVERKAELGGALLAADAIDDPAEASAAFLAVAERGEYDYPVVARLRAGAALMQSGDLDAAQEQYETIRAMSDIDPRFRDLAELRIVMMRSQTMDPAEMLDRLSPLTVEASVWRLPALEYEAAAHLRADDPEAALASLRAILAIPQLPAGTQGRVAELVEAVESTIAMDAVPVGEAPPVPAPDDTETDAVAPDTAETGGAVDTGDAPEDVSPETDDAETDDAETDDEGVRQ